MKRIEWILLFIVITVTAFSVRDLFTYEDNPHCTQVVSFHSALTDFSAHEEERPAPLIYRQPFALPLRAYFALFLFIFLLAPALVGLRVLHAVNGKRTPGRLCLGAGLLFLLNVPATAFLAGERFYGLYIHMLLWAPPLYAPALWLLIRKSREQE